MMEGLDLDLGMSKDIWIRIRNIGLKLYRSKNPIFFYFY